jgi:hypothetical protein
MSDDWVEWDGEEWGGAISVLAEPTVGMKYTPSSEYLVSIFERLTNYPVSRHSFITEGVAVHVVRFARLCPAEVSLVLSTVGALSEHAAVIDSLVDFLSDAVLALENEQIATLVGYICRGQCGTGGGRHS